MVLPDVPIVADVLLNEYHERLANMTAANIRLTAMVHAVVNQRDAAIRRVAELESQRGGESAKTETIRIGNPPGV